MLGGVFIRTGSVIAASGVRVVSGLVQRLGSLSFIVDNAGCLAGRLFPRDGQIMSSVPMRCTWGLRVFAGISSRCWWRRILRRICWLTLGVALAQ
jgi:hypothetical protein